MYCMRCGRETKNEQVFCDLCLENMKKYPVKPGTAVQLPDRSGLDKQKPVSYRRQASPEEQVTQLRNTVRILIAAVTVLSLFLVGTALLLIHSLNDTSPMPGNLGRNYTAAETEGS